MLRACLNVIKHKQSNSVLAQTGSLLCTRSLNVSVTYFRHSRRNVRFKHKVASFFICGFQKC